MDFLCGSGMPGGLGVVVGLSIGAGLLHEGLGVGSGFRDGMRPFGVALHGLIGIHVAGAQVGSTLQLSIVDIRGCIRQLMRYVQRDMRRKREGAEREKI